MTETKIEIINKIIRGRRSVYPNQYIDREIPKTLLQKIIENAHWAPSHKLTQPWRFKVLTGSAKDRFGQFLAEKYKAGCRSDQFMQKKYEKLRSKPGRAAAVVLICMQRDPQERIPEWEELASVATAVQNIWLTTHAHGIGAYWSSPPMINHVGEFTDLNDGEKCIGIFYMGYYAENLPESSRTNFENKLVWIND